MVADERVHQGCRLFRHRHVEILTGKGRGGPRQRRLQQPPIPQTAGAAGGGEQRPMEVEDLLLTEILDHSISIVAAAGEAFVQLSALLDETVHHFPVSR